MTTAKHTRASTSYTSTRNTSNNTISNNTPSHALYVDLLLSLAEEMSIKYDSLLRIIQQILKNPDTENELLDFLGFDRVDAIFTILDHKNEISSLLCTESNLAERISHETGEVAENEYYLEHKINTPQQRKREITRIPVTEIFHSDTEDTSKYSLTIKSSTVPFSPSWLFSYDFFNDIQSDIFPTAYNSDSNYLLSAPTGSGKTDVAMMSVLRTLQQKNKKVIYSRSNKNPDSRFVTNKEMFC